MSDYIWRFGVFDISFYIEALVRCTSEGRIFPHFLLVWLSRHYFFHWPSVGHSPNWVVISEEWEWAAAAGENITWNTSTLKTHCDICEAHVYWDEASHGGLEKQINGDSDIGPTLRHLFHRHQGVLSLAAWLQLLCEVIDTQWTTAESDVSDEFSLNLYKLPRHNQLIFLY